MERGREQLNGIAPSSSNGLLAARRQLILTAGASRLVARRQLIRAAVALRLEG